jgi:hypothetical protein
LSSLNQAWEAHKVRNKVVHEGLKFDITRDEAVRAYRNYLTVFQNLGFEEYVQVTEVEEKHEVSHH